MSARLSRARLLLSQSRPADAERELLPALAESPDRAEIHALLALCRVRLERGADALQPATTAGSKCGGSAVTGSLTRTGRPSSTKSVMDGAACGTQWFTIAKR